MKKAKLWCGACLSALIGAMALTSCSGGNNGKDTYDKNGRLIINFRNVYFEQWNGEDNYTEILNEKFGVKIKATSYSYGSWDTQIGTAINGNNLTDVNQFNLKHYNFGSSYEKWIGYGMLKPLPDDLSRWPNLQNMINNISNIDYLKVDGKLYCIPVANDITNPKKDFSNMTYVYRRDWAKQLGLYKENDTYTWDEFLALLSAFKENIVSLSGIKQSNVLVDEGWGFPSIANFYKNAPHCYDVDENGKAINAFTSDKYIEGLKVTKTLIDAGIYSRDQRQWDEKSSNATTNYLGGKAAVLYDNFTFTNYLKLRNNFKSQRKAFTQEALDDGTAFLKVIGPDGKYALENDENWFSITMFNYKISDEKLEKTLDILDYLLTEEGTRLGIYGQKDYDYTVDPVTGEIILNEMSWEKNVNTGEYAPRTNGAKYLRYVATLGHDTKSYDPYTDTHAYELFTQWDEEMKNAKAEDKLRIIAEPANISWMSTPAKNKRTKTLLDSAKLKAIDFCYGELNEAKYISQVESLTGYKDAINEINAKLGK